MQSETSESAKRLKELRKKYKVRIADLAAALGGDSPGKYLHYEDRYKEKYLPLDISHAIAPVFEKYGLNQGEFYRLMYEDTAAPVRPVDDGMRQPGTPEFMAKPMLKEKSDFIVVEEYDARGSMGPGSLIDDSPLVIGHHYYSLRWVRKMTSAPAEMLKVITASGDSMEPTISDGSKVLIDLTQREPYVAGIYAIAEDSHTIIKRLQMQNGKLLIISDNPKYPPYNAENIRIIGRAIDASKSL